MKRILPTAVLFSSLGFIPESVANSLRDSGKRYYEELLASAVILSDSDLISLGIKSFDPNEVFKSEDDNLGGEGALEARKKISVYNLPLHFDIAGAHPDFQHEITLKFSYFSFSEDVALIDNVQPDRLNQDVYSAYLSYTLEYSLTDRWKIAYGIGSYLMYADNDYRFKSADTQQLQPFLDQSFSNMSVWSTFIEPYIEFKYQVDSSWGRWGVMSQWHYFAGVNWDKIDEGSYGSPEGWRVSNGIQIEYDLASFEQFKPALYGSVKRIDIGHDATSILQTNSYYEAGVGVTWANVFDWDFIDTVGIGVNFNYGSSLRGGSLLFYINPFNG
ncbi:Solitary outer membrane autotransporter beta-barrel domain [Vibrio sp. CK2-1]|uniref:Solitary outer membrane autotransporter beta-barrel domain n=1 Tax=Vibrio sp. CK2-1 TaxID=2912249 RepID=UPI001F36E198|nr:Solitary outer membrane autotransporter beta-barrel domain [Vibrio sp. CK2-1]MCF7354255.1 Solitary outer membrane autotransporter beta-barrel domain [Vibrio sp. CK2-1]